MYVIVGVCLLPLSFAMRLVCRSFICAVVLYVYVFCGPGSVSGGVCSFMCFCSVCVSVEVVVQAACSPMLFHLDGAFLLGSLQFFVLLFIAFVFCFRSTPMLADVALVQAWVGPQVGA